MRVTATHTDTIPQSVAQRTAQKSPAEAGLKSAMWVAGGECK